MQNVVPKEGPRAPLFFSVVALLLLADVAAAQSVELSVLEHCASLDTPEDKLACFEAIVVSGETSPEEIPDAAPAIIAETAAPSAPEPVDATQPQPGTDSVPVASSTPETALTVDTENTSPRIEPVPGVTETRESAVGRSPEPAVSALPAAEFGAEQLPDPERDADQTITATVVEVRQGYNRTLSFHMADGQVWRQIEARRLQYPKNEEFEVIISQGMLGEYRLRIGENGRLVKIRRVK